jgi:hypothetical protein
MTRLMATAMINPKPPHFYHVPEQRMIDDITQKVADTRTAMESPRLTCRRSNGSGGLSKLTPSPMLAPLFSPASAPGAPPIPKPQFQTTSLVKHTLNSRNLTSTLLPHPKPYPHITRHNRPSWLASSSSAATSRCTWAAALPRHGLVNPALELQEADQTTATTQERDQGVHQEHRQGPE